MYKFMWGQKQSAMIAEAMLRIFSDYNDEFSMVEGVDDVFREHNKGFAYVYYSEKSLKDVNQNGRKYLDETEAKRIIQFVENTKKNAMDFYHKVASQDSEKLSDTELLEIVKEYKKHMIQVNKAYRSSDPSSTSSIEEGIKKILSTKYSGKEYARVYGLLSTSPKLDRTQRELMQWQDMICANPNPNDEQLFAHALKYPEKYANAWTRGEVVGFLRNRIKQTDLEHIEQEIVSIKRFKEKIPSNHEEVYSQFPDKPELRHYCEMLQYLGLSRFELKEAWGGAETKILDFLHFLSEKTGLDMPTFMAAYNYTDLIDFLENDVKLTGEQVQERMDYSIIHYKDGEVKYLFGDNARDYFNEIYTPPSAEEDLTGMTANPGKYTGRVQVIRVDNLESLAKDMESFKQGDVIVTTMTSPLVIPIAVKAGAIVTNQGGICSHAAVISREFNIPCIVGTHDATQILKDGDIVEVDADEGIVRKRI